MNAYILFGIDSYDHIPHSYFIGFFMSREKAEKRQEELQEDNKDCLRKYFFVLKVKDNEEYNYNFSNDDLIDKCNNKNRKRIEY